MGVLNRWLKSKPAATVTGCRLVPHSTDVGRGYVVVRVRDGQRLSWDSLPQRDGPAAYNIVGESHHATDLQDEGR